MPQFVEFRLGPVVAGKPGGAFELGDEGIEGAVLVVRRTEIAQAGMGLGFDCSESAAVSRDLPMPGSPEISTTRPSPLFACSQRRSSSSISSSRPTSGVSPERNASKRLNIPLSPMTRHAGCGSAKPASACGPEIGEIEQPADLPARRFGDDERVRHGERLQPGGEVRGLADDPALLRRALADQIADHGEPGGDAEPHAQILSRRQSADRLDHRQPGAHRPLGIVLMRLRIAEIDQHPVAHVLGDKAVEAADRLG